jgi:hypothetical protein
MLQYYWIDSEIFFLAASYKSCGDIFSAESEDVNSCKEETDEGFQTTDAGSPRWYKWGPSGQQYYVVECCNFWVRC